MLSVALHLQKLLKNRRLWSTANDSKTEPQLFLAQTYVKHW